MAHTNCVMSSAPGRPLQLLAFIARFWIPLVGIGVSLTADLLFSNYFAFVH